MSVLVVYESHHNRAGSVVNAIADAATARGVSSLIRTIGNVTPADVDRTDAVIAGCWMPGHAPLSSESTQNMMGWIENLGPMNGKPVGLFCTYRFFPYSFADMASRTARMERELTARFERKGANVVAKRSIYFKSIDEEATELVQSVIEHVGSTLKPDTAPHDLRRAS
jgi:flavodoxin